MRFVRQLLRGLWRGLDGLRRVLHLLLLLGLLVAGLGVWEASEPPKLPSMAALVVRPSGEIVEQLSGEPLQRSSTRPKGRGRRRRCCGI